MLRATRRQRTLARPAEVRGVGFFHGADVTLRFHPAEAGAGIVFQRTDLPGRPTIPARLESVVPSQRRTTIRSGDAGVEMIEHVMAALAGLQVDNAVVEIDAGECPGCDGSSRAFVEALDGAGIVEQDRMRPALVVDEPISIREGDAVLAIHPPGAVGRPDPVVSPRLRPGCGDPRPELLRGPVGRLVPRGAVGQPDLPARGRGRRACAPRGSACGPPRPTSCSSAATASSATSCATPTSAPGTRSSTWSATSRCWASTCTGSSSPIARATRPTPPWAAGCSRPATPKRDDCPEPLPLREDGTIDVAGIMSLLPHRYPFLLVDRVLELGAPERGWWGSRT